MYFDDDICGIYRFKNKINDKSYVGQSIHIKQRFLEHTRNIDNDEIDYVIYRALRKYGINSFDFEILEECNRELLNEREIYWISYYDSYHNGYNMTIGGQGCGRAVMIPVDQYSYDGRYLASYDSIADAMRATGAKNIGNVCKGYKYTSGGFQWFFKNEGYERNLNNFALNDRKKVQQYDLNGNFIKEYISIFDAANELGISHSNISRACNEEVEQSYGYQWKFSDDFLREIKPIQVRALHKRKVAQYDKEGNFINKYDSISEAERALGIKSSNITRVCQGKAYESDGFQWRYIEDNIDYIKNIGKSILKEKYQQGAKTASANIKRSVKSVYQCDKDNHEIIKYFNSIREASNQTQIYESGISKVCLGKRKSAGGYYWKFATDN